MQDENGQQEQSSRFSPENHLQIDPMLFEKIYTPQAIDTTYFYKAIYIKGENTNYHTELYFDQIDQYWYLAQMKNVEK